MSRTRRVTTLAMSLAVFAITGVPVAALAIVPVVDISAQPQWILNIANQTTQITHQVSQIARLTQQVQAAKQNLQSYQGRGLWVQLTQRLVNLRAQIAQARRTSQISGSVADAQITQMNQEIATAQRLQQLADTSSGGLQAAQAQSRLTAELVAQIAEQRQLSLSQAKQVEFEQQEAMDRFHAPAQRPSTY